MHRTTMIYFSQVVLYEPIADTRAEPNAHGTHVVGSICGQAQNNSIEQQYDGMAPQAKVVFQGIFSQSIHYLKDFVPCYG